MRDSPPRALSTAFLLILIAFAIQSAGEAHLLYVRISVASDGRQATERAGAAGLSADGRFVVFCSISPHLVPDDTDFSNDTFVHDRVTRITTRESVDSRGPLPGCGNAISATGRFVAFQSQPVFVGGASITQIYVRDRELRTTTLASASPTGEPGNGFSNAPSLSGDGRFVTFTSTATNLVAGDTNNSYDVFTRDLVSGTTTRESVSVTGAQGAGWSFHGRISSNGRYVVFSSDADNLMPGDVGGRDVFVRDRWTNQLSLESLADTGAQLHHSYDPTISDDGRFVAFSRPLEAPRGFYYYTHDLFIRDRFARRTQLVASGHFNLPLLSDDGRFLTFDSNYIHPLIWSTVTVYDRELNQTIHIAAGTAGTRVVGNTIAFSTHVPIVENDTNEKYDVYVAGVGGPAVVPPGAPDSLVHTIDGSTVNLRWAPAIHGSPATDYMVEVGSALRATDLARGNTGSTATTLTVRGVPPGRYFVRIRAINAVGISPPSNDDIVFVSGR